MDGMDWSGQQRKSEWPSRWMGIPSGWFGLVLSLVCLPLGIGITLPTMEASQFGCVGLDSEGSRLAEGQPG